MTAALPLLAPLLALDEIEQLELTVDAGLRAALDALTALRERDVHTTRGYALWHEYVLPRFGDALVRQRLPDGKRQALVASMCTPTDKRPRGLPVRAQSAALGVAVGTVQSDRVALGLATPRAPRPASAPPPPQPGTCGSRAAEWLRRARDGRLRGSATG